MPVWLLVVVLLLGVGPPAALVPRAPPVVFEVPDVLWDLSMPLWWFGDD